MAESPEKQRVVIVGAGFAGFNAARELSRLVGAAGWSSRRTSGPRCPAGYAGRGSCSAR